MILIKAILTILLLAAIFAGAFAIVIGLYSLVMLAEYLFLDDWIQKKQERARRKTFP